MKRITRMSHMVLIGLIIAGMLLPTACKPAPQPAPTEVPPTAVPPTEVPPTEVPPTEVPPTEVPPTEVPPTPTIGAPEPESLSGTLVLMTPIDPTMDNPYAVALAQIDQIFLDKYPNAKLEYRIVGMDQMGEQFALTAEAGDAPDVFYFSRPSLPIVVQTGQVGDLSPFIERDLDLDDFNSWLLDGVTYEGKTYAVPNCTDLMGLYYRKDLLDEAGLQPPETWDDVIEVGKALTKDTDGDGKTDQWGMAINGQSPSLAYMWGQFILAKGGTLTDGSGKATFNSPEAVAAVEWLNAMMNEHKIISPDDLISGDQEVVDALSSGKAAMALGGMFYMMMFPADVAENIGVTALPMPADGKHVSFAGGWTAVMSTQIEDPELGWAWIKAVTSAEAQEIWNKLFFNIPSRISVREDPFFSEGLMGELISKSIDYGVEYPYDTTGEYWNVLAVAIQEVAGGLSGAEEALNNAVSEYNAKQ